MNPEKGPQARGDKQATEPTEPRAIEREGAQLLKSEIVRHPSLGAFKRSLAVLCYWGTSCLCMVGELQVVPWVEWWPPQKDVRVPALEPVNGTLLGLPSS